MSDENSIEKSQSAIQNKVKDMQKGSLLGKIQGLKRCILIDGSSSMTDYLPGNTNRHEVVKKVYKEHLQQLEMRMFNFNDDFEEIKRGVVHQNYYGQPPSEIPYPSGGTDMTMAFYKMDSLGVERCILVTDGQPNDPKTALEAADKTKIQFDIVYIGEPPIPDFLLKLGNVKGNSFQRVDMLKADSDIFKELGTKIKGLLGK